MFLWLWTKTTSAEILKCVQQRKTVKIHQKRLNVSSAKPARMSRFFGPHLVTIQQVPFTEFSVGNPTENTWAHQFIARKSFYRWGTQDTNTEAVVRIMMLLILFQTGFYNSGSPKNCKCSPLTACSHSDWKALLLLFNPRTRHDKNKKRRICILLCLQWIRSQMRGRLIPNQPEPNWNSRSHLDGSEPQFPCSTTQWVQLPKPSHHLTTNQGSQWLSTTEFTFYRPVTDTIWQLIQISDNSREHCHC